MASDRGRWDDVCHDLRTPLSIILGYSEMLLEDVENLPAWKARALDVQRVRETGHRLLRILDDAMAASRAEAVAEGFPVLSARLHRALRAPLDEARGAIDRVVDDTRGTAESDAILVDLERIRTAGRRFDALLEELAPPPTVEAVALRDAPLPRPISRPSWLPPPPGMPRNEPRESVPAPGSIRALTGKLLVVDDNESNRAVLSQRLSRQGHTVSVAAGGLEALALLGRERFDLVLLDVMMPDMDGPTVLKRLREAPATAAIPVVFLTAKTSAQEIHMLRSLGALDIVAKPFDPMALHLQVKKIWQGAAGAGS